VVVGDLVEVIETQTSGIEDGAIGIIVKIEQVSRHITIYWVNLGIYGMHTPLWDTEIRLLSGQN
tara:strand:+ start:1692 stop:1883 length:192 start_codon:yes stop_codon:yes gene_type:complete